MRKQTKSLARPRSKREPYAKVLIVCEGKKTEPNYIMGLKNHLRLNNANVAIIGEGATPTSIVLSAKKWYQKEHRTGDPFDKVFCVFDKDQHTNYNDAMQTIDRIRPNGIYMAITSVPAFEYWLLLHYQYSERPCNSSEVIRELKRHMPQYEKGNQGIFAELQEKLEDAKQNATRSLDSAIGNQTDNPSTLVHELVDFLQKLKQR